MSPGLKTEFFEQMSMDFCADLKNWTALLLATDDVPLVHSVSYGWQGNLTKIGCTDAAVAVVSTCTFSRSIVKAAPAAESQLVTARTCSGRGAVIASILALSCF